MKTETNYSPKRNLDQHAYIDIVKRESHALGPIFHENWHEELQFYYLASGCGVIHCDSDVFDLKSGGAALINCSELHRLENRGEAIICYTIRIDLASLFHDFTQFHSFPEASLLAQQLIVFHHQLSNDCGVLIQLRVLIREYEQRRTGYELAMRSIVLDLFVRLIRSHVRTIYSKKRLDLRLNSLNQMKATLDYIQRHYQTPITVCDLAQRALMSEAHFCRTFKMLYGQTVIAYINAMRVKQADSLLKSVHCTITEIALKVGFNDANYFSRVYKQQKGMTPRQARQTFLN
jgi:AraC-like DNA-binding protein